jgi:hypothetical protein
MRRKDEEEERGHGGRIEREEIKREKIMTKNREE